MVNLLEINDSKIHDLINITKSNSNISGYVLRETHFELGKLLGEQINKCEFVKTSKILILIKMRSGLCFGLGVSDSLEKANHKVHVFFDKVVDLNVNIDFYDRIIVVDGVINSGKSILEDLRFLSKDNIIVATNVISKQAAPLFSSINLYSIRISEISFIGSKIKSVVDNKGPDTSERLFKSDFYD